MADEIQAGAATEGQAEAQDTQPAYSHAVMLAKALEVLNHPGNLAVPDRLHSLENVVRVLAAAVAPMLD